MNDVSVLRNELWKASNNNLYAIQLAAYAVDATIPCHDAEQLTQMIKHLQREQPKAPATYHRKEHEDITIPHLTQDWWHRYERAYYSHIERTCPAVVKDGHYCTPNKPKPHTSGGLRSMMKEYLYWTGHMAEAVNTMGKPVKKMIPKYSLALGKVVMIEGGIDWHKSGVTKGSADLPAQVKNPRYPFAIPVKWEIKIGKDTQSKNQEKYEARVTTAGGLYFIVKTPEQFFDQFDYVMSL